MGKTFPELKKISQNLADRIGIPYDQAASIVAAFSAVGEWDRVDAIAAGDMETIKEGAARRGVAVPGVDVATQKAESDIKPATNKKPPKKAIKADKKKTTPAAVGFPVYSSDPADYVRGELPETITDDIKTILQAWADDNGMDDLTKISSIQWHAACLFIGQWFKGNKVLHDIERERAEGGSRYDGEKIAALIPVWEYITGLFKHLPLHVDFISFCGISRDWFFNYNGQGVTSSCMQIAKKVMEIETAAISVGVTDSRENPTGRIFYAKARLGWRENDTITQIDDKNGGNNNALPVFDLPKIQ